MIGEETYRPSRKVRSSNRPAKSFLSLLSYLVRCIASLFTTHLSQIPHAYFLLFFFPCTFLPSFLSVQAAYLPPHSYTHLVLREQQTKNRKVVFFLTQESILPSTGLWSMAGSGEAAAIAKAREHIEEMRRVRYSIGGDANQLSEDLHQAVKYLSAELYAKDVHFLMELIQVFFFFPFSFSALLPTLWVLSSKQMRPPCLWWLVEALLLAMVNRSAGYLHGHILYLYYY